MMYIYIYIDRIDRYRSIYLTACLSVYLYLYCMILFTVVLIHILAKNACKRIRNKSNKLHK